MATHPRTTTGRTRAGTSDLLSLSFERTFEPHPPASRPPTGTPTRKIRTASSVPRLKLEGVLPYAGRGITTRPSTSQTARGVADVVRSVTSRPCTSRTEDGFFSPSRMVSPTIPATQVLEDEEAFRASSRVISALATDRRMRVKRVWNDLIGKEQVAVEQMWASGQEVLEAQLAKKRMGAVHGANKAISSTVMSKMSKKASDSQGRLKETSEDARRVLETADGKGGGERELMQVLYLDDAGGDRGKTLSQPSTLHPRKGSSVKVAPGIWHTGNRDQINPLEDKMSKRAVYLKTKLRQMNKNVEAWLKSGHGVAPSGEVKRFVYTDTKSGVEMNARDDAEPFLQEARELSAELKAYHGEMVVANQSNHVAENARSTWSTRAGVKHAQILRSVVERARRDDEAMRRRLEGKAKVWEDMHEILMKKGPLARLLAREKAEKAETDRKSSMEWLVFVTVHAAALTLFEKMVLGKMMMYRRNAAARKILRFCRKWKDQMLKRTRTSKRMKFMRKGMLFAQSMNLGMRVDPAADKVLRFLRDYIAMTKVVPAIHAYKRKVTCMQRCIRHFLARTREASAHNEAVWRTMEHKEIKLLMREKRKTLQEEGGPVLGRPKLGGGRGDPESISEDAIPHLVLDVEVMRKSLQRHIKNQRTKFMLKLGEYRIQVAEYRRQKEQRGMLIARIAEFTGETDWSKVEQMTAKLANTKKLNLVPRPKRVIFSDRCTEHEMRDLWYVAVEEQGSVTVRSLVEEAGEVVRRMHTANAAVNVNAAKKAVKSGGASFIDRDDDRKHLSNLIGGLMKDRSQRAK